MFEAALHGLMSVLSPTSLLAMLVGIIFGAIIGVLPGLGGIVALSLLVPFTFGMDPTAAIAMLLGAHIATIDGDAVTSILFNVPGAGKSIALCFDGYPMTKKGEAGKALGASGMSSLLGGVFGAIVLTASFPVLRAVMLSLGPPEYLMMALLGLSVLALFHEGSVLRGLASAGLGLMIAFVGMDPVTGIARFTFGSTFLLDGIDFSIAVIGLFAVAEMIKLYVKGGSLVQREASPEQVHVWRGVWEGVKEAVRHWRLVIRSSVLGLFVGVVPGVGASVGNITAYAQAAQWSRHPEKFGTGNIEGVIAPQAANGSNEAGALLPTLGFGVPGGEGMAILLTAFTILGIAPGREMLTERLDLSLAMVWILVLASIASTALVYVIGVALSRVTVLPGSIVVPTVLAICFIGAYAVNGRLGDVLVAAVFGCLGYLLQKFRYSRAALVVGMVLGAPVERYLHVSLTLHGPGFLLGRPIALVLFLLVLVSLVYPFVRRRGEVVVGGATGERAASG